MLLPNPETLCELAGLVARSSWTALCVQGYGSDGLGESNPRRGQLRLLALAPEGQEPVILEVGRWKDFPTELADALSLTRWIMHDAQRTLTWMDLHYQLQPPEFFCTLTASRLLTAGSEQANDLESLAARYRLHIPEPPDSDEWGGLFLSSAQMHHLVTQVQTIAALHTKLLRDIEQAGLAPILELECRLLPVVLQMEKAGLPMDRQRLESINQQLRRQLLEDTTHLRAVFGVKDLNFSSPSQVLAALQERGIEVPDTREKTLLECQEETLIPALLAYRSTEKQWQQARSLLLATGVENRIHPAFDPLGTDTGHFASGAPNLQNVARGLVRSAFRAVPARRLIIGEYAQAELRAVAAWSQDEHLRLVLAAGGDPHLATAAVILNREASTLSPAQRALGKCINLGWMYGQGAETWVATAREKYGLRFSVEEAMVVRDRFFDRYRQIAAWHQKSWKMVQEGADEIRTPLGRRRLVSPTANRWNRFTSFVTTPIQGGTADGLKWAMLGVSQALPSSAALVATVQDALIVEAAAEDAHDVALLVQEKMLEGMARGFPGLQAEVRVRIGEEWA